MARQNEITKMRGKPDLDLATTKRLIEENEELRVRLSEAEETLHAIHSGEVDAIVVSGPVGEQVFALKGAEYAYRALVEAMNEGAATLSAEGVVLYCNQRLAELVGVPAERIVGAPVAGLFALASPEEFTALLAKTLAGEPTKTELQPKRSDGKALTLQVSLSRMGGESASAACIVVTDVTEHKQRDELIAAGELARSILASAAEAIAVCNNEGIIISANHELTRVCGFNPLFQPFDTSLPLKIRCADSDDYEQFSVMRALAGENFRAREATFRAADGSVATLLFSAAHVSVAGRTAGCVLTMTDITQRKLAEAALLRSEKLAALGRLAATIAHEVNNPLAAAINSVFIASSDPTLSPQSRSFLEVADQELRRAALIASQALGFCRVQSCRTPVELPKLVDEIVTLYSRKLQQGGITVERRYKCCACPQACLIGNASEIRQLISNLLMNSIDAIRGKGVLYIRLSKLSECGAKGAVIRLTIADTGVGIRKEHFARIFEPFFTTKESMGTGLGMWISQEIVLKHGGSIRVRSREGRGTVCCVLIPAIPAEESSAERKSPSSAATRCAALDGTHSRSKSPVSA